jgi:tetratricopeptide (TPR) repeat protein
MSQPDPSTTFSVRADPALLPRAKWWGRYVFVGSPQEPRLVFRWSRIIAVLASLAIIGYLSLATSLWGYYAFYRRIPDVKWIDVAVLPRFSRVQSAIGAYYFSDAKKRWENKDYARAIFTARAAVLKAPRNLDARLFLADCWSKAGRPEESIRTLRDGIEVDANDPRLQRALVTTCLATGHFKELLKVIREDLPAKGVRLLESPDRYYQIAEVTAVLETSDAIEAEKAIALHPNLEDDPAAAPLLARVDWELDRRDSAFSRLQEARRRNPNDPGIQDAYVDTTLRMGKNEEAHIASEQFLRAFPTLPSAQLRFLEVRGFRQGSDRGPWLDICGRYLVEARHRPDLLAHLATLASSEGWSDLAFLLYQNSLHDNLAGFPFVMFYVGSLVKSGDYVSADAAWRDLSVRNAAQLVQYSYLAAMIAWGDGRESEALQIVDQLNRDTATDLSKRKNLEGVFREFGFNQIADDLVGTKSQ